MAHPDSEVYTATYSGIQVFEMTINDLSMMRRRSDSYLNATQILKLGGLEKGKRTKILEREILPSIHEKIQGGYGKYQGTWVPFERGRELAERYNVLDLLLPLLDFDTSTWDQLPEKEQMTVRPPRQRNTYGFNVQQTHASPPSSPSYPSHQDAFTPASLIKRKIPPFDSDENGLPNLAPLPPSVTPKKRPKKQQCANSNDITAGKSSNKAVFASPARSNINGKKDEPIDSGDVERQVNAMLSIFSSGDDDHIPPSLSGAGATAGLDMDVSLDDKGHTALHWSVALARIHTVEWLISKGATVTTVNHAGETALMRGVMATCIYDHECFPQMLDILRASLSLVDRVGRSVLHHIILSSLESRTTMAEGAATMAFQQQQQNSTTSPSLLLSSSPSLQQKSLIQSAPSPSSILPTTPSSQSETRQIAAKLYMQNVLRTIHQHKDHLLILNKPDDLGETPLDLASRLRCMDLYYLLAQAESAISSQDSLHLSGTTNLALPQAQGKQDLLHKKPKKKADKKYDRKISHSADPASVPSAKGQELVSTVQRIVDAMDLEFSSKLQVKEADVARMQQEIRDLSHQLDEGRKEWNESKKASTDQLTQAHTRIKHLEEMLGRLGVKELEIGSIRSTTRETQLEQQISKLQSDALTTTQRLSSVEQSYADLLVREMGCKRLIAACCNLPLDKVDEFIEPLTIAVENDPPDMDFARVIGFMEKLRQHQQ